MGKIQLDEVRVGRAEKATSGAVHVGKLQRRIYRARAAAQEAKDGAAKAAKRGDTAKQQQLLEIANELDVWADQAQLIANKHKGEMPSPQQNKQEDPTEPKSEEPEDIDDELDDINNEDFDDEDDEDGQEETDSSKMSDVYQDQEADKQKSNGQSSNSDTGKTNSNNSEESSGKEDDSEDELEDEMPDKKPSKNSDDEEGEEGSEDKKSKSDDDSEETDFNNPDDESDDENEKGNSSTDGDDGEDEGEDDRKGANSKSNKSNDSKAKPSKQDIGGEESESAGEEGNGEDENDDDFDTDLDDELQQAIKQALQPIENPFDKDPKSAKRARATEKDQDPKLKKSDTVNHKTKLDLMKKVLKMLVRGEKDGARAALMNILNKRGNGNFDINKELQDTLAKRGLDPRILGLKGIDESLQEAYKAMELMDDDEFEDTIGDILNKINTISPVVYATPREDRTKRIAADNTAKKNKELSNEDKLNKNMEIHAKAKSNEYDKYKLDNLGGNAEFEQDLQHAIMNQIKLKHKKEQTYSIENRRYAGTTAMKRGERDITLPQRDVIKLVAYLDCSGSFDYSDIEKERAFLATLQKYVDAGDLQIDIKYFSNNVFDNYQAARAQGGTSAWDEIIDEISTEEPDNVLIVTDSDMEDQARRGGKVWIPGCVWYVWKVSRATSMLEHLQGDSGTWQYSLD